MPTTVREDQILLRNGQVVNKTTVERWQRQAHVGKLLRPFRTEVSRARKKREARLANRKLRRIVKRAPQDDISWGMNSGFEVPLVD